MLLYADLASTHWTHWRCERAPRAQEQSPGHRHDRQHASDKGGKNKGKHRRSKMLFFGREILCFLLLEVLHPDFLSTKSQRNSENVCISIASEALGGPSHGNGDISVSIRRHALLDRLQTSGSTKHGYTVYSDTALI